MGSTPTFAATGPQPVTVSVHVADSGETFDTATVNVLPLPVAAPPPSPPHPPETVRAFLKSSKEAQFLVVTNQATGQTTEVRLFARPVSGGVLIQVVDVDGDGRVLATIPPGAFRKLLQSGPVSLEVVDCGGRKTLTLWGKVAGKWTSLVFDAATGRRLG